MTRNLVAIDPGDVHVGVAFFDDDPEEAVAGGWRCVDAQEFEPDEFSDAFAESLINNQFDVVVIERFRLYGDKSKEQTGSEFETSQLIGILKWLVRKHNDHVAMHTSAKKHKKLAKCEQPGGVCHNPPREPTPVKLILQMADIKKPTTAILKRKGIKSVAKPIDRELYGGRGHVVDAELHGWKAILDKGVD